MQALIVYLDDQPFAVPRSAIHEVMRVEKRSVVRKGGSDVIPHGDGMLPIVYLHEFFGRTGNSGDSFHVFVTDSEFGAVGIAVDRVAGLREIVVRRVDDALVRVQGIAGATDLGDGRPALILGVAAIVANIPRSNPAKPLAV
jgi:two-component system chemotaxis sensor kinase CheA